MEADETHSLQFHAYSSISVVCVSQTEGKKGQRKLSSTYLRKFFPPYFQHFPSVLATSFFYGKESKGEGDSFVLTSSNSPTATVQTSD